MPYNGLDSTFQVKATSGGSFVSVGRVDSAELQAEQSIEHFTGATGESSGVYSMLSPKGSASVYIQNIDLLDLCVKTVINGLPPCIDSIAGGSLGTSLEEHQDAYIDTLEISLEKGGLVKADVSWVALTATVSAVTTAATALAKNLVFEWVGAAVTFAGAAYDCQSVKAKLENGLSLVTDLDAKTAGLERFPTAVLPGHQKVTAEAEFAAPPLAITALTAPHPATVALVFQAKNTAATVGTLTVTVANARPVGVPTKIGGSEDLTTWALTLEADLNDLTALDWGVA